MVSQSRAMIGPWLAANTPTSSAMCHLLGRLCLQRIEPRYELALGHAADLEVEAQQIGVDQRRKRSDVVDEQRPSHVGLDRVAVDHAGHVGTIIRRQLGVLVQVEEQLAHPVVGHRWSSAVTSAWPASVPIPKFASLCGTLVANFGIEGH